MHTNQLFFLSFFFAPVIVIHIIDLAQLLCLKPFLTQPAYLARPPRGNPQRHGVLQAPTRTQTLLPGD